MICQCCYHKQCYQHYHPMSPTCLLPPAAEYSNSITIYCCSPAPVSYQPILYPPSTSISYQHQTLDFNLDVLYHTILVLLLVLPRRLSKLTMIVQAVLCGVEENGVHDQSFLSLMRMDSSEAPLPLRMTLSTPHFHCQYYSSCCGCSHRPPNPTYHDYHDG